MSNTTHARDSVSHRGTNDIHGGKFKVTRLQPDQDGTDWFAAIENASAMLRDGGRIGVVDFYLSRKFPQEGHQRHGWLTRSFWPLWFGTDNVFPSADHVPFLEHTFQAEHFSECRAKVPYLPLMRVPYYRFIGRRQ